MNETPLWTSQESGLATGGQPRGNWSASGVSIDTRTLVKGDLFIALKGNNDGHAFAAKAYAAGAAAAVMSGVPQDVVAGAPMLLVPDTQRALEDLGRASRARSQARVVAVTGSAGKTTTKEMLRTMLSRFGAVSASLASYNNHWGVPLSLARMPRESRFGVFEIGMNHAGEIRALVAQVRPHVAIVTTIAPAHLEFFGTLEAIADAKGEIFEGLTPEGVAIVPADNGQAERLKAHARAAGVKTVLSFGTKAGADAVLLDAVSEGGRQVVRARVGVEDLRFAIGADGMHIAANALAALLVARALDLDPAQAAQSLENFTALGGRGARFTSPDRILIIDESYNANPASMAAALDLLARAQPAEGGRRIAVLGDMLELGENSAALHRDLAGPLEKANTDLVFLAGPQMKALWGDVAPTRLGAYAETSAVLAPQLMAAVKPGDVVLVKGSFGSRMATIIAALKAGKDAAGKKE
jgi:UDP-N-acetylmuramoyl-tripeptide--D-alanyl-D-alanine ligase